MYWKASCRDHPYSIQKSKKLRNVFIYKKPDTFQKARLISVRFLYTKSHKLDVTGFSLNFSSWYLYTNIYILWATWSFYIQKARHFAKS